MTCERTALVRDGGFSTRAEDGSLYIEGYFAVFGSEYKMWENAIETIDEDAFDDALNGDIRALVNHDTTLVLGRTTAGTLSLRADKTGLWGSVTINQADQDAMNLYERVKRGDVSQCSFGFDIIDQSTEVMENGTTVWKLNKVKLYEVSVVTFPAYEDTSVQARKRDYEEIQKRKKENGTAEKLTFTNNQATFTLKKDEYVDISCLPTGWTYTVTETEPGTNFKASYSINGGTVTDGAEALFTMATTGSEAIQFTNTSTIAPPVTGRDIQNSSWIMMLIVALLIGMSGVVFFRKVKRKYR